MRIAFISDIHGNQIGLEAVLDDIQQAGVDQTICLGDIANLGPHPSQCLDIVQERCDVVLQGNHELYLLGKLGEVPWQTCPTWASMRWAREQLRPEQFGYMRQRPLAHQIPTQPATTCVHASPLSQYKGFLAKHDAEQVAHRMHGTDHVTLFCSHTHVPLFRTWSHTQIVNTGSVGMPLDGTPEAKYVLATQYKGKWQIEFRRIPYNLELLMQEFDSSGIQKVGGMITAVFRYQMLTGKHIASKYLGKLHAYAREQGRSVAEVYDNYPAPAEVQQWL